MQRAIQLYSIIFNYGGQQALTLDNHTYGDKDGEQQALRPDNRKHGAEDGRASDALTPAPKTPKTAPKTEVQTFPPNDHAEYCAEDGRAAGAGARRPGARCQRWTTCRRLAYARQPDSRR